jgi:hypothetical protein
MGYIIVGSLVLASTAVMILAIFETRLWPEGCARVPRPSWTQLAIAVTILTTISFMGSKLLHEARGRVDNEWTIQEKKRAAYRLYAGGLLFGGLAGVVSILWNTILKTQGLLQCGYSYLSVACLVVLTSVSLMAWGKIFTKRKLTGDAR